MKMPVADLDINAPRGAALTIALVAALTIAGAFVFQASGYAPCKLCLEQRYAYYAGIVVSMAAAWLATPKPGVARLLLVAIGAIFLFNAGFGVFHSGVEWGWWSGPSDCSPPAGGAAMSQAGSLLQQMQTTRTVNCSEAALRILGLSLAGWSAIICAGLAVIAFNATRQN